VSDGLSGSLSGSRTPVIRSATRSPTLDAVLPVVTTGATWIPRRDDGRTVGRDVGGEIHDHLTIAHKVQPCEGPAVLHPGWWSSHGPTAAALTWSRAAATSARPLAEEVEVFGRPSRASAREECASAGEQEAI
jgi:hypothetical protein